MKTKKVKRKKREQDQNRGGFKGLDLKPKKSPKRTPEGHTKVCPPEGQEKYTEAFYVRFENQSLTLRTSDGNGRGSVKLQEKRAKKKEEE